MKFPHSRWHAESCSCIELARDCDDICKVLGATENGVLRPFA